APGRERSGPAGRRASAASPSPPAGPAGESAGLALQLDRMRSLSSDGEPSLGEGLYLSLDTRTGPHVLGKAFPPDTLRRLSDVKAAYDPGNVFRNTFPIPPADRAC
ncbi:BBE domain-containing protein, partial [Streptomyces sp. NPDC096153]|uniref:BBE domain-containing protein n=1 Tax=Streptomyces sp. NPDC096153 TaxID=3155548 RepID=UPI00331C54AB